MSMTDRKKTADAVGESNLGNRPNSSIRRILTLLTQHGAGMKGLEEAGDRRAVILDWCRENDHEAYFGDGSRGADSTPLIWPSSLTVTNLGTRPATDPTYTGKLGAGPSTVKAKVWNHARVHGAELGASDPYVFINGHLPASLYLPRRRAVAKKQIAVLVDMIERREGRVGVVVVGDFNCRPNALILRPLRKLGMKQHTKKATHGRRIIDHVWTLDVPGQTKVVNVPSDHNAVVFTLRG